MGHLWLNPSLCIHAQIFPDLVGYPTTGLDHGSDTIVIFLMEIYNDKQSKHSKNTHIKLHHIKHPENAKICVELSHFIKINVGYKIRSECMDLGMLKAS